MSHTSKLDPFHYHEAMDRLSLISTIMDDAVIQHPVVKSYSRLGAEVESAATSLYASYQMAAHMSFIFTELDPIFAAIANDYQFDKSSEDYCGFLNTCPEEEWSPEAAHALKFLIHEEYELFRALLDRHGLDVEDGPQMQEVIFIKKK
jgi:hypothetical protein